MVQQQKILLYVFPLIFAITGPASYLGAPEAKTTEMLVEKINASGGVGGRKIELIMKDSGSKPESAVSLAKQLIDEKEVLAIIGPSTSGETMAIKNVCQEGKTILVSCAAAEAITDPVTSYVFKVAPKDSDAARWIFKTMKAKGLSTIGVISSNDGFGMAGIFTVSPTPRPQSSAESSAAMRMAVPAADMKLKLYWAAILMGSWSARALLSGFN